MGGVFFHLSSTLIVPVPVVQGAELVPAGVGVGVGGVGVGVVGGVAPVTAMTTPVMATTPMVATTTPAAVMMSSLLHVLTFATIGFLNAILIRCV